MIIIIAVSLGSERGCSARAQRNAGDVYPPTRWELSICNAHKAIVYRVLHVRNSAAKGTMCKCF